MLIIDIDGVCLYSIWFRDFICKIYSMCCCDNSSKCECNCRCNSPCNGKFICLCECNNTKGGSGSCCCICICKKQGNEKCKCICICICTCDKCCCESGTSHNCDKCSVKINILTLCNDTCSILHYLNWIRCYISRIENKCCLCSCCGVKTCDTSCCSECARGSSAGCCCCSCGVNGKCNEGSCEPYCCCKEGTIKYLSIITRIHFIEFLLKEISAEIYKLAKLYKTLSSISMIGSKCKPCQEDCSNKIKILICNIKKALRYYYLFAYRAKDIRPFLEYKEFYPKSNQILCILERSIKCLIEINNMTNDYILNNVDHSIVLNKFLMNVYSHYNIVEIYVVMSKLSMYSSKISYMVFIFKIADDCHCVCQFDVNIGNVFSKILDFYKFICNSCDNELDGFKKIFIPNDGNHLCLCLVIKYLLYPSLIKSMYCMRNVYLTAIGNLTREFLTNNYILMNINYKTKLLFIIIDVIYRLSRFIDWRLPIITSWCFCQPQDTKYYHLILNLMLYVSSLIENIWSMDYETMRMGIEKISIVLSELKSTHIYTNYYSVSRCKIYRLMVNKECKTKAAKCCCCWCPSIVNVLVMCVSLCIQCKLCNALCNNKKPPNGCDMTKKFFTIEECKCDCQSKEKGVCCLPKLAACSQATSKAGECKTLKELLDDCTKTYGDNCCCKNLAAKLENGLCKLVLLGCGCDCTEKKVEGEVKGKIMFFNYPSGSSSVAVVVYCKCDKTGKPCCCLYQVIEKLKEKLGGNFEKICEGEDCVCDDLKSFCNDICGADCAECVCKDLPEKLEKICNGTKTNCGGGDGAGANNCLCKLIKDTISKVCGKTPCPCKNKEGCCKCPCCRIVAQSIRLLTRACRGNVLEPYKRITIELLRCGNNKGELMRRIVKAINQSIMDRIFLLKNNLLTFSSYGTRLDNRTTDVTSARNWGYDTLYEHQSTTDSDNYKCDEYPNLVNNPRTESYRNSDMRKQLFNMIYINLNIFKMSL